MKAYTAFIGKEFIEYVRTYKLLIIGLVFLLLGIMSPLTAKYMPDIIRTFMPEGIQITITEPTALDSWLQFVKNVSQMGTFVIVILFSGMMAGEYSKGTLINILTKGLPRRTVVFAKFTQAAVLWIAAYFLSFGVAYAYTWFYWRDGAIVKGLLEAVLGIGVFGIFLVAATLLGSIMVKTSYGSLLFTGGLVVLQMLLNMIPKVKDYNPIQLISGGGPLLQGQLEAGSLLKPIAVAMGCIIVSVIASCLIFNRKKL